MEEIKPDEVKSEEKKEMTIAELEMALKLFIVQLSEKTPVTFNVAINAFMNTYVNTFLQFVPDKHAVIENIKAHSEQICYALSQLIEEEEKQKAEAAKETPKPDIIVEPKE